MTFSKVSVSVSVYRYYLAIPIPILMLQKSTDTYRYRYQSQKQYTDIFWYRYRYCRKIPIPILYRYRYPISNIYVMQNVDNCKMYTFCNLFCKMYTFCRARAKCIHFAILLQNVNILQVFYILQALFAKCKHNINSGAHREGAGSVPKDLVIFHPKCLGARSSFRTSYRDVEGPRLMQLPVGQLH